MARNADTGLDIPAPVLAVGERILAAGGVLYIVGGWVRDRMMGAECYDIDLATDLTPTEVKVAVEGVGTLYDLGERFGTVGLKVGEYTLEITTFRREEYSPGSRHPEVGHIDSIEADLTRRDFTVNAMALSVVPADGRFLDPFGGREDIARRVLRTPGPPGPRMAEDPLRMLRAARFASQLGFAIESGLQEVMLDQAGTLETVSWERKRDELERILATPDPASGLRILVDTGLMDHVSPEISMMRDVDQPRAYHRADVLEHTLLTVGFLPPDPLLRRAALFHDVGKPAARVTEPKTMFPEHEKIGEELTRSAMRRLRYSNEETRKTVFLVRRHMRPIQYRPEWSDAAVRRLIRDCTLVKNGSTIVHLGAVIEIAKADILAGSLETVGPNLILLQELEGRIEAVRSAARVESARSPLDGNELMRMFGRGPGPWLKAVKQHLTELVVNGELDQDDKESARERARQYLAGSGLE